MIRTLVWLQSGFWYGGDESTGMGYGGDQDTDIGYDGDQDAGMRYGCVTVSTGPWDTGDRGLAALLISIILGQ